MEKPNIPPAVLNILNENSWSAYFILTVDEDGEPDFYLHCDDPLMEPGAIKYLALVHDVLSQRNSLESHITKRHLLKKVGIEEHPDDFDFDELDDDELDDDDDDRIKSQI